MRAIWPLLAAAVYNTQVDINKKLYGINAEHWYPTMWGSIGKAAEQGVSSTTLVYDMTPFGLVGNTIDLMNRGGWNGLAHQTGGVAGMMVVGGGEAKIKKSIILGPLKI